MTFKCSVILNYGPPNLLSAFFFFFFNSAFIYILSVCTRAKNKTGAFECFWLFFFGRFSESLYSPRACAVFRFFMLSTVIPLCFRLLFFFFKLLFYHSDIRQTFFLRHVTLNLDKAVLRKISPGNWNYVKMVQK